MNSFIEKVQVSMRQAVELANAGHLDIAENFLDGFRSCGCRDLLQIVVEDGDAARARFYARFAECCLLITRVRLPLLTRILICPPQPPQLKRSFQAHALSQTATVQASRLLWIAYTFETCLGLPKQAGVLFASMREFARVAKALCSTKGEAADPRSGKFEQFYVDDIGTPSRPGTPTVPMDIVEPQVIGNAYALPVDDLHTAIQSFRLPHLGLPPALREPRAKLHPIVVEEAAMRGFKAGVLLTVAVEADLFDVQDTFDVVVQILYPDLACRIYQPSALEFVPFGPRRYRLHAKVPLQGARSNGGYPIQISLAQGVGLDHVGDNVILDQSDMHVSQWHGEDERAVLVPIGEDVQVLVVP
ncbi:hypothetical protein BDK51DRAFT_48728 [Blyttiomyces helicus]|uniref:Integrator complex subunit 4/Protein SIEL C-terminal Ig-like domain-containing protein n=1 Tax=Blyttiomyces helicus TaxID=388810 RepID=A0A4P9W0V2_9FUNG|nr:hypothetical protein BDK51DRAFT_48728 [Blyttiomyces helicus]|eukprot:RKO84753.1 hypothetical protein BDK51DRAFT_48728 [Blyttiomyces helicus]